MSGLLIADASTHKKNISNFFGLFLFILLTDGSVKYLANQYRIHFKTKKTHAKLLNLLCLILMQVEIVETILKMETSSASHHTQRTGVIGKLCLFFHCSASPGLRRGIYFIVYRAQVMG